MKDKHPQQTKLTNEELQLIEQLRKRPEILERFRSILVTLRNNSWVASRSGSKMLRGGGAVGLQ